MLSCFKAIILCICYLTMGINLMMSRSKDLEINAKIILNLVKI